MNNLVNSIVELYRKTATELPEDIEQAIIKAKENEEKSTNAYNILNTIIENIKLSRENSLPICQDTGTPIFYVYYSKKYSQLELKNKIIEATKIATKEAPLRPNAVDSLTDINTKNNVGVNFPIIRLEEWDNDFLRVDLMLKGGGSENVGIDYKLPDSSLNAGRDINGIKKCIINAVFKAQGKGCSPGIVGVGIGGSKDVAYEASKKQFFRKLNDKNENEILNNLENELFDKLNKLDIGPMGLGGKTTGLGVKIASMHRHPASFFVAVSYMCWACRRRSLIVKDDTFEVL